MVVLCLVHFWHDDDDDNDVDDEEDDDDDVSTVRSNSLHKRVKPCTEMSRTQNKPQVTWHNSAVKRRRLCHTFVVYVLLTVNLVIIIVNNQLDAQFFSIYVNFYSVHVSDSHVSIIRWISCINTTSGICHSVQMTVWYAGLDQSKPAY